MTIGCFGRGAVDPVANASTRFAALSTLFDPATKEHLLDRGLAPGWRCLEVGAGGGSIARWLSERVGSTGRVLATDIETRFLNTLNLPNLEVLRHDITRDPMPDGSFDLVHARMILVHLRERDDVLSRLAAVVRPGGWLVCEEFDGLSAAPDHSVSPGETMLKAHHAMQRLTDDQGLDRRYGRLLFGRLRSLGLTELGAEATMSMAASGSPMAVLLRASYERRRSAMIDAGYITATEFEADLARMEAADFMMPSPLMWTAWGRRREVATCADI
jgi:SAM-dependent methyltransferase